MKRLRHLLIKLKISQIIGFTPNAKFAIRKITRGIIVQYLPMVKEKGLFNQWIPIVKIYDRYVAMPYERQGGLNYDQCEEHIKEYKKQLLDEVEPIVAIEYEEYNEVDKW
jgi:hypothetical protein